MRPSYAFWKPTICCRVVTANTLCTWAENTVQQLSHWLEFSLPVVPTRLSIVPLDIVVPVYLDEIMTPVLITRRLNATDCDRVSSLKCFVCLLVLFLIFLFSLVNKYKHPKICNVLNMWPSTQGWCYILRDISVGAIVIVCLIFYLFWNI